MGTIAKCYPSKEAMEATQPPAPSFEEIFARLKGETSTPGLKHVFPDLPRDTARKALGDYAPWLKGQRGYKSRK
jgi:hypothetical protein